MALRTLTTSEDPDEMSLTKCTQFPIAFSMKEI